MGTHNCVPVCTRNSTSRRVASFWIREGSRLPCSICVNTLSNTGSACGAQQDGSGGRGCQQQATPAHSAAAQGQPPPARCGGARARVASHLVEMRRWAAGGGRGELRVLACTTNTVGAPSAPAQGEKRSTRPHGWWAHNTSGPPRWPPGARLAGGRRLDPRQAPRPEARQTCGAGLPPGIRPGGAGRTPRGAAAARQPARPGMRGPPQAAGRTWPLRKLLVAGMAHVACAARRWEHRPAPKVCGWHHRREVR